MLRVGKREQYYYRMLHLEIFCGDFQYVGADGGGYASYWEERTVCIIKCCVWRFLVATFTECVGTDVGDHASCSQ